MMRKTTCAFNLTHFCFLIFTSCLFTANVSAQTVSLAKKLKALQVGKEYTLAFESDWTAAGIVQLQLVGPDWKKVTEKWKEVEAGKQTTSLTIRCPADVKPGTEYFWQLLLYDRSWKKQKEAIVKGVVITAGGSGSEKREPSTAMKTGDANAADRAKAKDAESVQPVDSEWTPTGEWVLDWQDEFEGTGEPEKWYPFLGFTPDEFSSKAEKGIRWNGKTEESSQMYSSKSGNHWLNGKGELVLRVVTDKTKSNANGKKVDAAYLMTGYPAKWDKTEPSGVKWQGKFFSPAESPLYICTRIKTNELKGFSTWFAFWVFSKTRSYNGVPADGTEIDVVEIPKGKKDYLNKAFNVANHWAQNGKGSESLQLNSASDPKSTDLVDVNDDQYHTYGVEWTKTYMKCYVDGKLYYTFTENIPTDPVDMMILLTLEYQKNVWDPDQGDGRTEGPFVSDDEKLRVMSQVYVDYVRVYKQK